MSERIEQIITNIEESFNKLNTSVEQLQKAENIASSSVATTSTLITEFKSSIDVIEKLVKVDFANEYKKLTNLNNNLLEKINKIDFDNKFQSVEKRIVDKNFDAKFSELTTAISNKNFNLNFQSIEEKIRDKNFDTNFTEIKTKIDQKNFDDKFKSVEEKLCNQESEAKRNTELLESKIKSIAEQNDLLKKEIMRNRIIHISGITIIVITLIYLAVKL